MNNLEISYSKTARTSITQLCAGTQYIQVSFQYAFAMPGLAISPPTDNSIRKRFKIQVKKPDSVYLNIGKYVRLSRSCKEKESGCVGNKVVLPRKGAQPFISRQKWGLG
jgi:hypothetical protein